MPMPINNILWDFISPNFIVKLPSSSGYDSILVIVDRFTKINFSTTILPKNWIIEN
jgi:hypothetical protein